MRIKNLLVMGSLVLGIITNTVFAEQVNTDDSVDKRYSVIRLSATLIGFDQGELESSMDVILGYEIGKVKLPKLKNLTDEMILNLIDHQQYPYNQIEDEKYLIVAKRRELETVMLAKKAKVSVDKFTTFYNNFALIMETSKDISSNGFTTFTEVINITCDRSCQGLANGNLGYLTQLYLAADAERWEEEHGSQTYGTKIVVTNPNSPNQITVTKYLSSLAWQISGTAITTCGDVRCKRDLP